MKIAQVAPLYESVPPKLYGGTERVVSYLTEELVRQGHDVTLFASGDSTTSAHLVPLCERSLRLDPSVVDPLTYHILMLEKVFQRVDEFDIIHFHIDYLHFPLSRAYGEPNVTTLHGRLDLPELGPMYDEFGDMPVVSISDSQRTPLPHAGWVETVYHGLPLNLYDFHPKPGGYLAFVGRISPEKRVDRAVAIARRVGMPLRVAAKVDKVDQDYFEEKIEPLFDDPLVEFVGEINEAQKNDFLGNAHALIFPIGWQEPFGLVMIEAMACGTPVVAYHNGSTPEVIDEGVTGYLVSSVEEAARAVEQVGGLSRERVRRHFEQRFSAARMARDYVHIYRRILTGRTLPAGALPVDLVVRPNLKEPIAGAD